MLDVSIWEVFDRIVPEYPDREIVVTSAARRTYSEFRDRSLRVASELHRRGFGCHRERSELVGHESGQDHVGLLMGNRIEYLESMFGALRARAAPVNLNYRYTAAELAQLLEISTVDVLVYEADLAPVVREAIVGNDRIRLLIEVGSAAEPAIAGALLYEELAGQGPVEEPPVVPSADDLIVACTGGTTGLPKGVLWRQGDMLAATIGNPHTITNAPVNSLDDLLASTRRSPLRILIGPPLMHFSGFGTSLLLMTIGGATILADPPRGLDPVKFWQIIEREKVKMAAVVGDAFGRPLLDELRRGNYDTSSMLAIMNGGAAMSDEVKDGLYQALGKIVISDGMGSTEGGIQGRSVWKGKDQAAQFTPGPQTALLSEDRTRVLAPGEEGTGWLATTGRLPLGYLNEPRKTAETFPTVEGRRFSLPGDRARWRNKQDLDVLGRDAVTINSGGEKVFAEEVQRAVEAHPSVREAIIVGRPSERWGQEVVAIVALKADERLDTQSILEVAGRTLARYKLPKAILQVDAVQRTAMGKLDYTWGREHAMAAPR